MNNGPLLPPHMPPGEAPQGAVEANQSKLAHINTYGDLPEFYVDYSFACRECGKVEVWTAERQKWYYEEAKGHIWAVAVRCRDCREASHGSGEVERIGESDGRTLD